MNRLFQPLRGWLQVRRAERRSFALAFGYFFCLIGTLMLLRPVRETLAIRGDITEWLFTGTFVVMLALVPAFGYLVARLPRRIFLPLVYAFFVLNLLGFALWGNADPESLAIAATFFIWMSVFNLFAVSVFWSLMVDIFSAEQGKRLFPVIAAGGSLGGITGPLLSVWLVDVVDLSGLFGVAAIVLCLAMLCQRALLRGHTLVEHARPLGGGLLAGAREVARTPYLRSIALVLVFLPFIQTFLYFAQQDLVREAFASEAARLKWFGWVDMATQIVAWVLQIFLASRLMQRLGLARSLTIMPAFTAVGLAVVALMPTPLVFGIFQALRRGGEYGLMKPAREVLFTPVSDEDKYKAKNFIDTAVYRGGDMGAGWLFRALPLHSLPALAALCVPLAGAWAWVAWRTGRQAEEVQAART